MNETTIDKLTSLGTEAARSAIDQYTRYEWLSSWLWMVFAVALIVAGVLCLKNRETWFEGDALALLVLVGVCCLVLSAVTCIANIPDLAYPRAKAIHQLLKDATGKDS